MASSEELSNRRIFILPQAYVKKEEDCKEAGATSLSIINLRHPFNDEGSRFLYEGGTRQIFELSCQKDKYGSWFVDSAVQEDGSLYIASKFDPLFLILPYLKNSGKDGKYILLDQLLKDEDYPDCGKLSKCATHEQLSNIAEISGSGDYIGFKYSQEKALTWLSEKVRTVREAVKSSGIFIAASDDDDKENEDVHLEYAFGIVSNYISEDMANLLQKHMNIRVRAEKRHSIDHAGQGNAKKMKGEGKEADKAKKKPKISKAQRELSKVDKKGMKSISSFFSPASKKR